MNRRLRWSWLVALLVVLAPVLWAGFAPIKLPTREKLFEIDGLDDDGVRKRLSAPML